MWVESGWRHAFVGAELTKVFLTVYHCANPWFGVRELEDELAVYQKIPGQFKPTVQELTLLEMFILHASTISHFCSNKIL